MVLTRKSYKIKVLNSAHRFAQHFLKRIKKQNGANVQSFRGRAIAVIMQEQSQCRVSQQGYMGQ